MFRVINEYLGKVDLQDNEIVFERLKNFLENEKNIKMYDVTVNFKRFIVDVRLDEYSVEKATEFFKDFSSVVSYSYSNMSVRYNEGKCVRYRYITSKENKEAFYCDIVIS